MNYMASEFYDKFSDAESIRTEVMRIIRTADISNITDVHFDNCDDSKALTIVSICFEDDSSIYILTDKEVEVYTGPGYDV